MSVSMVYMDGTPANPGVKEFQIKTKSELSKLPTTKTKGSTGYTAEDALASAGSECICAEGPTVYKLFEEEGWVEL